MPSRRFTVAFERLQNYRVEGVGRWIHRERFLIWNQETSYATSHASVRGRFYVDFWIDDTTGLACAPAVTVDHVDPWELRAAGTLALIERVCRELRWSSTASDLQGILARMRAVKYAYQGTPGELQPISAEQYRPL